MIKFSPNQQGIENDLHPNVEQGAFNKNEVLDHSPITICHKNDRTILTTRNTRTELSFANKKGYTLTPDIWNSLNYETI